MVYFTPTVGEFRPGRNSPVTSPKLPTDDLYLVYRGGAWNGTTATRVRAAYRNVDSPSLRGSDLGFRTTQTGCRGSR